MATSPFVVERFGGLNLLQDPEETGATTAVAMSNADLDQFGRVRTRTGFTLFTGTAATTTPGPMSYYAGSESVVAVTNTATTTQYAISTGVSLSTVATAPTSNNGFARGGTSGNPLLLMADQSSTLNYLNGTTWGTVAGLTIAAEHLAITPTDSRIAYASANTVAFGDPGSALTFPANNFVAVLPGDGEDITALVAWRDYLFAFKRTKFFVFYGNSTDVDGDPIFNYRTVAVGHGASRAGGAVAGEEGVYFADATGIYVTSGDTPRYISRAIEPWLRAGSYTGLPSFALNTAIPSQVVLAYHERRLYVTVSGVTLVYDPALDAWMVWSLTAVGMCSVPTLSTYTGLYFGSSAAKKIAKVSGTTDNGSAIAWSWTSGLYDLSGNNRTAVTLESAMWGTGTVTLQVANDHGSVDTGSAVTLGTSPAVVQGWQQVDREGVWWQHQLSGSGPAVVNRLAHYVQFVKPVGVA